MKPKIRAEMHLLFENDFDVNEITRQTGIMPTECKRREETRVNPITKQKNAGYWTLASKECEGYDVAVAINDLLALFVKKMSEIKKICEENGGEVIFDIVTDFSAYDEPAICFDKEFLKIVNFLSAEIQIDMNAKNGFAQKGTLTVLR